MASYWLALRAQHNSDGSRRYDSIAVEGVRLDCGAAVHCEVGEPNRGFPGAADNTRRAADGAGGTLAIGWLEAKISSPPVGRYGEQTCDGYDDSSATLWLTSPAGASPIRLDVANGGKSVSVDNSSPRWSPGNGIFRGEKLYWLVFSSRRPYGLQVNTGAPLTTRPQLWFSAIVVGGELFLDPSRPAVWLPNQNPTPIGGLPNQVPSDNHTPRWVTTAVPLPG